MLALGLGGTVKGDHVRPDLIYVSAVGVIHHVGAEAAAGTHIDFQSHDLPLLAQTFLILVEAEELKMHETALDAKALDGGAAGSTGIFRQILVDEVQGVIVIVHHFHQVGEGDIAGFEDGVTVGVDDGIIGVHLCVDELFHDIGNFLIVSIDEVHQIFIAAELIGGSSAHAVIRLHHHGIADLVQKCAAAVQIVHHVIAGHGDARLFVISFHLGLVLDAVHLSQLETAGDIEIGTQTGILHQPVLIVGLQPVNPAVLVDKICHCTIHSVIVFHAADLIVFIEIVAQLRQQLIVRLITDAQHIDAIVLQMMAKLPVVRREVGGNKHEILHRQSLLCITDTAHTQTGHMFVLQGY